MYISDLISRLVYYLCCKLVQVVWAESGWNPVALVDIIEGDAVKKAYQKALLCLHPDKLQQKGATSHQKYIAQKVFDILQVILIFKIYAHDDIESLTPKRVSFILGVHFLIY